MERRPGSGGLPRLRAVDDLGGVNAKGADAELGSLLSNCHEILPRMSRSTVPPRVRGMAAWEEPERRRRQAVKEMKVRQAGLGKPLHREGVPGWGARLPLAPARHGEVHGDSSPCFLRTTLGEEQISEHLVLARGQPGESYAPEGAASGLGSANTPGAGFTP